MLAAIVLGAMLVAPAPIQAVDPTPAPPTQSEMFRQPAETGGTRAPAGAEVQAVTPPDFHDSVVFSGLTQPTAVAFAADGRVFVAEKAGVIKVFDSLTDPTATVFADLRTNVHSYWDRGLLGLAVDPAFTTNGRVYALYTYNHILGDDPDAVPKWPDSCPNPPGGATEGCVASGRLSRLNAGGGGVWDGIEHVLVEDWCQVHPSHSIGTVAFGPDGALYAGAGESASFFNADWARTSGPPTT
jgi:glucose/arabinose dehydrogenase